MSIFVDAAALTFVDGRYLATPRCSFVFSVASRQWSFPQQRCVCCHAQDNRDKTELEPNRDVRIFNHEHVGCIQYFRYHLTHIF